VFAGCSLIKPSLRCGPGNPVGGLIGVHVGVLLQYVLRSDAIRLDLACLSLRRVSLCVCVCVCLPFNSVSPSLSLSHSPANSDALKAMVEQNSIDSDG
jgi:hypothetical protein